VFEPDPGGYNRTGYGLRVRVGVLRKVTY
jgi:hypothetical protein